MMVDVAERERKFSKIAHSMERIYSRKRVIYRNCTHKKPYKIDDFSYIIIHSDTYTQRSLEHLSKLNHQSKDAY